MWRKTLGKTMYSIDMVHLCANQSSQWVIVCAWDILLIRQHAAVNLIKILCFTTDCFTGFLKVDFWTEPRGKAPVDIHVHKENVAAVKVFLTRMR